MKATFLDLRRRMKDVLRALDRGESVTLLYRGKERAVLVPAGRRKKEGASLTALPFYGMWEDREEMRDVGRYVRRLRKGRVHAL